MTFCLKKSAYLSNYSIFTIWFLGQNKRKNVKKTLPIIIQKLKSPQLDLRLPLIVINDSYRSYGIVFFYELKQIKNVFSNILSYNSHPTVLKKKCFALKNLFSYPWGGGECSVRDASLHCTFRAKLLTKYILTDFSGIR